MALGPACPITPSKTNYTTQRQPGALIQTKLDGGKSATRLDQLGAADLVTINWQCNSDDYDALSAWYEDSLIFGSLPFPMPLILRTFAPITYTCQIIDGSFGIQSHQGEEIWVQAQMEVVPS